jgi:hypothetical protein
VGDPAGRGTGTMRGWAVLVPWRLNVSSRRENVHHSRFTSGGGLRCHRLRSAPPAFEYVARLVYAHSSRVAAAAGNRVFRHRARREPQGSQSILPCDPCGSLRALCLKVHLPPALTIRMGNGRWEGPWTKPHGPVRIWRPRPTGWCRVTPDSDTHPSLEKPMSIRGSGAAAGRIAHSIA